MAGRPLHALLLPPAAGAGRLLDALAAALDGSGPAILPLDPALPPARVTDLLHAFTPATVETQDGAIRWRPDDARPAAPGAVEDRPDGTAVVIATSGSTGEPKGVQLSAEALRASARASLDRIGAAPGIRWLCPLPTSHIAGLGILVRSLVSGTTPVVVDRLDPAQRNLAAFGCGYTSLVPAQLRRMLDAGAGLSAFGAILLGGAAIPSGLLAGARAAGARVITTYGMSETCGGCVYNHGPLDGVQLRTAPDGRIQIDGPVLFSGYRNRPDLTELALEEDGWFTTSDLGSISPAGRLSVAGRADDMINTGGHKVSPHEIAAILEACPTVREAAVFGEPDSQWGQRVTAVVVPASHANPPRLEELRAAVSRKLPAYAAPRALFIVPAMPLLPSGKPDLAALRVLGRDHAS
jgi:O-succinylbenzoic acid--CoA ligase